MLSLHDAAKLDSNFQQNSPHQAIRFPPGSCWLVFTDMVLHAALGGEFALEQTFHLDVAELAEPERADPSIGAAGRPTSLITPESLRSGQKRAANSFGVDSGTLDALAEQFSFRRFILAQHQKSVRRHGSRRCAPSTSSRVARSK